MASPTNHAVLVIADISGFTGFMRMHRMSVDHAKQVVVELLKSVIAASSAPLTLAEIEGDAAFFYAISRKSGKDLDEIVASAKGQVVAFFRAFYLALNRVSGLTLCVCDACANLKNLRLKVFLHLGEVAVERIGNFTKLFGLDVILVHRLLKNEVPSREYVMMTQPVFERLGEFYQLSPSALEVECEGIGNVTTQVFYPTAELVTPAPDETAVSAGIWQKIKWAAKLDSRFFMNLLGLKSSNSKQPSELQESA